MEPQPTHLHSRLAAIMEHVPRYAFMGATRLARDAGVSKSAVSRLMRGETSPSFTVMARIASALERATGLRLDPREIASESGEWGVPFVCDLMGCRGCLPSAAYDESERLRPEYRDARPGRWSGDAFEFEAREEAR
jgi:transcriptional regulator with XRE-family HTH domain